MQPFSSSAGVPIEAVSSSAPVSVDVALPHLLIHSEEIQRVLMDMEQVGDSLPRNHPNLKIENSASSLLSLTGNVLFFSCCMLF